MTSHGFSMLWDSKLRETIILQSWDELPSQEDGHKKGVWEWDWALQNSRDYATSVQTWNLDSMCGLVKDGPNFHRMFVCLDAYKKCLIVGCRPVIALDGCHLKGSCEGQLLLCAISMDRNDDMFSNCICCCRNRV
jgi:hypothetical protein